MNASSLLKPECVAINPPVSSQLEVIRLLTSFHANAGNLLDEAVFYRDVLEREVRGSTALTDGVDIPHAKSKAVKEPALAALTVPKGIECHALDGEKSQLFFLIAAPEGGTEHLQILSGLSKVLWDEASREKLIQARTPQEFIHIFQECEEHPNQMEKAGEKGEALPKILVVTACPTGLSHTYIAEQALLKASQNMSCFLRVETNGASGAENTFTAEEIKAADVVVIAADRTVDKSRFVGKHLLETGVQYAISHPKELLEQAMREPQPVYDPENFNFITGVSLKEATRKFYRNLMNGVSHMIPFVVAGGLLMALSFFLDSFSGNPNSLGTNTPVAAFVNKVGNLVMDMALPMLSAYIATAIADRSALVVGFTGGILAAGGITFTNLEGMQSAGFLGALIAGFVAGYLVLGIRRLTRKMPSRMESMRSILIVPVFGVALITLFQCLVNPYLSWATNCLLLLLSSMDYIGNVALGALLGAMMAFDLGGPVNKVAYVFATAALTAGDSHLLAAVMLGGMVPPLVTALVTTFFPKGFTEVERQNGLSNYVMGLCFVTEGAIPFAAADLMRVTPSCMIGSAIAGGMSVAFGCTLLAPHGGIFIFPFVGNIPYYLLSLVVGSLAGALVLALLRKLWRSSSKNKDTEG